MEKMIIGDDLAKSEFEKKPADDYGLNTLTTWDTKRNGDSLKPFISITEDEAKVKANSRRENICRE